MSLGETRRIPPRLPEPPFARSGFKRAERLGLEPRRFDAQGFEENLIGVAQNRMGARGDTERQPARDGGFRGGLDGHGGMPAIVRLRRNDRAEAYHLPHGTRASWIIASSGKHPLPLG